MDYSADNRRPVDELLSIFQTRLATAGWSIETIHHQSPQDPIVAFISPAKPGPSFWILGGIHGEEPASTEAFANEIDCIIELGKTNPIVFVPLFNPKARRQDWRYENEYRDFEKGQSVTTYPEIRNWVEKTIKLYPPKLVIDHHEDRIPEGDARTLRSCYVYTSGGNPATPAIAKEAINALSESGMPIADTGFTRFGEVINQGIIANSHDGSIDDYLSTPDNTVIVVETTIPLVDPIPLEKRVLAHQSLIRLYPTLWQQSHH